MDDKLDNLLITLDDEIEKKCSELKENKKEQRNNLNFLFICILFIVVPILMIFAGLNILMILIPLVLFIAFMMFLLSPIILYNNAGGYHNESY